jgi:magnesium transporter
MLFANSGRSPRETLAPSHHPATDAVWIDLLNPTEDECAATARATGLRVPVRDDIAEIESSSRLSMEGDTLYLNMPAAFRAPDGTSAVVPLGFVLSPHRLLTVRFATLPSFETFTEQFAHGTTAPCSMDVFVGLMEAIVERVADVLEWVGSNLDALSKTVFHAEDGTRRRGPGRADAELRATLTKIGQAGDTIGNLRDTLLGLGRIAAYVEKMAADWTPQVLKPRLETLRQDIHSLNDYDQQLSAKISFLLDAVLGFINIEQNNGVRVLTIASVVGIPPTFVVGLYGMNFKSMPEYDWSWGYQYGLALIAVSIILPVIWVKFKGWI